MDDLEEALAELSAAVVAQNFALGELLELLAENGALHRPAFLIRLHRKLEDRRLSELQRNSLRELIESISRDGDPKLASSKLQTRAAEIISLDDIRHSAPRAGKGDIETT